ncbi:MAG: hypothetical protein IJ279_01090 [Clostridia bacterium]|nr:hypothetical protein [Clostridia bacterium]
MKKTFRSHIILVTEGRLFCLLMLFWFVIFYQPVIQGFREKEYFSLIIFFVLVILLEVFFYVAFGKFIWPLVWGKLIVNDKGVRWRCLFKKSVFLSWDECKYIGFEAFTVGNVVKADIYKTGFSYIYFSTTPYPKEFSGKINKLNCKEGFIKFFPVNAKMCSEVLEHKDVPVLETYVEQYKRAKKREERLKKKRSEKNKSKFIIKK